MKKFFFVISLLFLSVNVFASNNTSEKLDPFYEEIFPRFFEVAKENIVSEDEIKSLINGIKETETINDSAICKKLKKVLETYVCLYGASQAYEIIKKIDCYSDVLVDKFDRNILVDENILSLIFGFKKVKDDECNGKIVQLFEESSFEFDEASLKDKIENWCKENNNEEALSLLNFFSKKLEEQDENVFNMLFNNNSEDSNSKIIKDLDETKSIPLYEKIADVFVEEFFLKLDKEEQIQMRFTLKEESIFTEESDDCIEIDENLFFIAKVVYMYIMLNQMEFYYSEMLDTFIGDFSDDSVFVQKMKDTIKSEMKSYRKDFEFASESFFSRTCSENKISMEAYSSLLWEAADKQMNKVKEIILSKLS